MDFCNRMRDFATVPIGSATRFKKCRVLSAAGSLTCSCLSHAMEHDAYQNLQLQESCVLRAVVTDNLSGCYHCKAFMSQHRLGSYFQEI